jgi:hypothetical protein
MQRTLLAPSLILLLFMVGACSADKPSAPPVQKPIADGSPVAAQPGPVASGPFSLALSPREPNRGTVLGITAEGFDITRANVQWLLNGSPVSTDVATQFNGSQAPKGSTVQAIAVFQGREVRSNTVEIRNTPPKLTKVKLMPETFKPGDVLMVEAEAADIDEDGVTILFAWTRNGAPAGSAARITGPVKRGDSVTVSVTPYDGQSYGATVVLNQDIRNFPPSFVEHSNYSFTDNRYSYQAQAVDPDGDAIVYSLMDPAEGMTMDRSTGELVWKVPPDFKGERSVTLLADDGHGGTAQYTVSISISR